MNSNPPMTIKQMENFYVKWMVACGIVLHEFRLLAATPPFMYLSFIILINHVHNLIKIAY